MAKRRPRLIPKVVFRVALTATAVPMLGACKPEPFRGVAAPAYVLTRPNPDDLPPQPTVAAPAYVNPPPADASADVKVDAAKLQPPMPGVASRGYEVEGVAYRGYELPKASAGPPGTPPPKH